MNKGLYTNGFRLIFCLISLFWKNKVGLWDHVAGCVSVYSPINIWMRWTNLYETWYVYDGTWAHLNGLIKKSLPSVCVYPLSLLGNGSVETLPR
jgi:hypothetical protein